MTYYPITPVAKPRMTQRDNAKNTAMFGMRPIVRRYFEFKQQVCLAGLLLPTGSAHVVFYMPMPKSWSKKKKAQMNKMPHLVTPDWDNLGKALSDACYGNDSIIWDIRITKIWAYEGGIEIR